MIFQGVPDPLPPPPSGSALSMCGWEGGRKVDGGMDGWMDGRMNGMMDGCTDLTCFLFPVSSI